MMAWMIGRIMSWEEQRAAKALKAFGINNRILVRAKSIHLARRTYFFCVDSPEMRTTAGLKSSLFGVALFLLRLAFASRIMSSTCFDGLGFCFGPSLLDIENSFPQFCHFEIKRRDLRFSPTL